MNTAKQLLWLPPSREEKYKAKQAVDAFFYRLGDLAAAGIVFVGTHWPGMGSRGFAIAKLLFVAAWLALAAHIVRENQRLSAGLGDRPPRRAPGLFRQQEVRGLD